MRFMVIVKATKDSEAGKMPDEKILAEMGKYNEELVKAGVMQAGEGLQASSKLNKPSATIASSPTAHFPKPGSSSPASGSGRSRTSRKPSNGPKNARTRIPATTPSWKSARSSNPKTSAPRSQSRSASCSRRSRNESMKSDGPAPCSRTREHARRLSHRSSRPISHIDRDSHAIPRAIGQRAMNR